MNRPTQQWLDRWIAITQRRSHQIQLVPMIANADDWNLLYAHNYTGADVLKFCDSQHGSRLRFGFDVRFIDLICRIHTGTTANFVVVNGSHSTPDREFG